MPVCLESQLSRRSLRETQGAEWPRAFGGNSLVAKFTLPLRFLGFGIYWAWMTTFWTGAMESPLGMPTVQQTTVARIAVQTATALSFVIAALLARRLMSSTGQTLLVIGGAVFGPLGTVVATLGHNHSAPGTPVYLALAWVSLGIACACITLLWGRFYASIGLKRASLYTPLSLVLAVLVGFILSSMQPVVAMVVTTLLPMLSVGMFLLVSPDLQTEEEQQAIGEDEARPARGDETRPLREHEAASLHVQARDQRRLRGGLWRIVLAIGVYALTLGFYLDSRALFGPENPSSMTGRLVFLFIPLVVLALLKKSDFGLLFRIALPLTAAGFLLLPLLGTGASWIGADVVAAGGTLFDIVTWIALSEIAHRRGAPIRVFGLGRAANAGGIALGWVASYILLHTVDMDTSPVLGFSVAMVFILILTTTLILREGDFPAEEKTVAETPAVVDADPGDEQPHPQAGHWRRCCSRIARQHSLSPREEEVMVLLAKGRSMKHIEETLVISYHTAKSHSNHIYRKLGVHSREELIDLVEHEHRGDPPRTPGPNAGEDLVRDPRVGPVRAR